MREVPLLNTLLEQYPDDMRTDGTADEYFDKWSGPGKDHVDPAIMERHLAELKLACGKVKKFVDKRIAHLDKSVRETDIPSVTWRDTNAALDVIEKEACACRSLLKQEAGGMLPFWQYDWLKVFREPWLPTKKADDF